MRRLLRPRVLAGLLLLTSVALVLLSAFILVNANNWLAKVEVSPDVWSALEALGTIGAVLLALWLAWRGLRQERDSVARLVSAWVTEQYEPMLGIPAYQRVVFVHIANESNEPVFDARVSIVVGQRSIPLGPLSAPTPIAVIPQRRERQFDISVPLLAHDDTWNPRVVLHFTDPSGRRWMRDENGRLENVTSATTKWTLPDGENDMDQLGRMDTLQNPMMVALAFLAGLREGETVDPATFVATLAPEAPGWNEVDWEQLREHLSRYQPTSMVDFPAPYIARIKLSGDSSLEGLVVEGEGPELRDYLFMTLTFARQRGWRVFGVGNHIRPDEILFAPGTFEAH